MDKFLELIAILILTLIGFVLPIVSLLLSVFNDGVQKLSQQYYLEKEASEENIKNQLQKIQSFETDKIQDIEDNLKELKRIKKRAQNKLNFLDPRKQLLKLFIPLFASFLLFIFYFIVKDAEFNKVFIYGVAIPYITPFIGFVLFIWSLSTLWKLLNIITEVVNLVNRDKRQTELKVVELLSNLVEKTKSQLDFFLKNFSLRIDQKKVDAKLNIELKSDEKKTLSVSLENFETRMAKEVEVGFIFPTEFMVEKSSSFTVFNDQDSQVIRFRSPIIQGQTHQHFGSITITPLKKGKITIRAFVKAENIEATNMNISFNIN